MFRRTAAGVHLCGKSGTIAASSSSRCAGAAAGAAATFSCDPGQFVDGLVPLDAIPVQRSWSFEAPTLTKGSRFTQRVAWATSDQALVNHLDVRYPSLRRVMEAGQLTLCGGAIASILMGNQPSDLDLYVVGVDSAAEAIVRVTAALEKIVKLTVEDALQRDETDNKQQLRNKRVLSREHIKQKREQAKQSALKGLFGTRRGSVITVYGLAGLDGLPVQINLVPLTPSQAVHDGDVDPGAMMLQFHHTDSNKPRALFSKRAAWSIQNWTIHPSGGTGGFLRPHRLLSYFDRGYDVLVPDLDLKKIFPRVPRTSLTPCFSLCDDAVFVELYQPMLGDDEHAVNAPPLTNRLAVSKMAIAAERKVTTTNDADAEERPTSSHMLRDVEEHLRSVAEMPSRVEKKPEATDAKLRARSAIVHNVRELLRGGKNMKFEAYGQGITQLTDVRDGHRITPRNVEVALHTAKRQIQKDPLHPRVVGALLNYFPTQPVQVSIRQLLGPTPTSFDAMNGEGPSALASQSAARAPLEELFQRQLKEAHAMLDQAAVEAATCPLEDLLPAPAIGEQSEAEFYGSFHRRAASV